MVTTYTGMGFWGPRYFLPPEEVCAHGGCLGQPGWRGWAAPPAAGRGWGGPLPPGNRTRENLFNRSGERPAIENPIAMGRVQRAESRCALPRLRMPTSRERRIFSTNSASGRETESRSAGGRGSGLGADARSQVAAFMITKDELGAQVLHRSPLRRAPVAPSAQRQDHAQRPRVNEARTRRARMRIGADRQAPGCRGRAPPGIEIKHANLFRTILASGRQTEIRAKGSCGDRPSPDARPPSPLRGFTIVVNIAIMSTDWSFEGGIRQ